MILALDLDPHSYFHPFDDSRSGFRSSKKWIRKTSSCNITNFQDGDYNDDHLENLLADFDYGHPPGVHSLFSKCVNTCCTGAHVQEVIHLFIDLFEQTSLHQAAHKTLIYSSIQLVFF